MIPSLCARCAAVQKTYCQEGHEIYVTPYDCLRIAEEIGKIDFSEFRAPIHPSYADQDDDPLWRDWVFRPDGTRRVLRRKENGDCFFLGKEGCVLSLKARPLVCRLFPFEYTSEGIKGLTTFECPTHLLLPGEDLLSCFAMDRQLAESWRRQLYEEILREERVCVSV